MSVAGGVGATSSIFQSGWKAVKCMGTSGPRFSTTHRAISPISRSESFCPGITRLVISSQTFVCFFR